MDHHEVMLMLELRLRLAAQKHRLPLAPPGQVYYLLQELQEAEVGEQQHQVVGEVAVPHHLQQEEAVEVVVQTLKMLAEVGELLHYYLMAAMAVLEQNQGHSRIAACFLVFS